LDVGVGKEQSAYLRGGLRGKVDTNMECKAKQQASSGTMCGVVKKGGKRRRKKLLGIRTRSSQRGNVFSS